MQHAKASQKLPEFLRQYFWDVDFDKLDVAKKPRFILKRVIDLGDTRALTWVQSIFDQEDIEELILTSRDLSRKTANYWTTILDLDPKKVPCLQKPYSRIPFGPSN